MSALGLPPARHDIRPDPILFSIGQASTSGSNCFGYRAARSEQKYGTKQQKLQLVIITPASRIHRSCVVGINDLSPCAR